MERNPSGIQLEFGDLNIKNIKISDEGPLGGKVTWEPVNGPGGGLAAFIITAFHAELIDDKGVLIPGSRFPAAVGSTSANLQAIFSDYPNNDQHPQYHPQANPPLARIRIVVYDAAMMARSSIILEDIAIKDEEPGGILGNLYGRKNSKLKN